MFEALDFIGVRHFWMYTDKWEQFEKICEQCDKENAYLVINFHNNNYNELDFPNVANCYEEIIKRLKEKGARFVTLKQAYMEITKNNFK